MPSTPCDERCSVQCTYCNVEVLYVVTTGMLCQQYDTSAVVSARAHGLLCILTGSFCRLMLYGLSLPVRTRNALQNEFDNGTPAVLSARAHLLDVIFGDYCDKQFFLQADGWQTLLPSIGNTWIIT